MARVLFFSELLGKLAALVVWWFKPWSPLGFLLFCGADGFVLYHLFVPSGQWLCRIFTAFETDRREIWLTIDDGPDAQDTPRILDLLDQYQARATFFVIGERVARWPHLVPEIIRRGHEVAHHTHTHPAASFWCASRTRLRRELDDALSVLRTAGVRPRWFRPPVGIKNVLLGGALKQRKLQCVGWTVRSGDCLGRTPEVVAANVMRKVQPGAILLMHEGPSVPAHMRVKAMELVLRSLTEAKYRCVLPSADQLLPQTASERELSYAGAAPRPVNSVLAVD
jgi:peptidoglycan-N-acetylglucosamine deacetylase